MMLKTAADFRQLAQDHPFCAGFLIMADLHGLSESEIQTGLVKAASVHPLRQAELERFVAVTGKPIQAVKVAAGGWGGKVRQMADRTGQSMSKLQAAAKPTLDRVNHGAQAAHNWVAAHPKTVGGAAAGSAAAAVGGGIGYDMLNRPSKPAASVAAGQTPTATATEPGPSVAPELTVPEIPGSIAGPKSYDKGTASGSPAWYTNPALLGGGGLLALALAARAMQSGQDEDEEDPDRGY